MEENLYKFVQVCCAHRMPITTNTLRHWAPMLEDKLVEGDEIEDEEVQKMKKFTASKRWEIKFAKRHALRSATLSGKVASTDIAGVAHDMNTLFKNFSNYNLDCIFNMEETGLFYKLFPRRT